MKTKLITLAVLLLAAFAMKAQQGDIIIVDFEPDSCITDQYTRLWVDLDNDGNGDIFLRMPYSSTGYWPEIVATENWEITWLDDDTTDTISNISHWGQTYLWLDDEDQSRFAARKQIENDNYVFVWFEAYNYVTFNPFVCHVCFDKYVYCSIPNYPLVWGQTEMVGIEETESTAFATIHPNPTTGLVAITGDNLRQVEVLNVLGQKVLGAMVEGNEFRIDLATLPAGVYFVNVIDEEGRKCLRKVVKQ